MAALLVLTYFGVFDRLPMYFYTLSCTPILFLSKIRTGKTKLNKGIHYFASESAVRYFIYLLCIYTSSVIITLTCLPLLYSKEVKTISKWLTTKVVFVSGFAGGKRFLQLSPISPN